jgi:hypothetical protein
MAIDLIPGMIDLYEVSVKCGAAVAFLPFFTVVF